MGMHIQTQAGRRGDSRETSDSVGTSWHIQSTTAALLWVSALCTGCTPDQAGGFGRAMFYGMIGTLILIPFVFVREYRRGGAKPTPMQQGAQGSAAPDAADQTGTLKRPDAK